jgi:hypothetical protein
MYCHCIINPPDTHAMNFYMVLRSMCHADMTLKCYEVEVQITKLKVTND